MWVEKRKDNRFKFVEQYKDPLTNKKKRVSITYEKNTSHTRKDAQLVLEKRIQDRLQHIQDGTIKKGVTFGEVVDEWKEVYKQKVRPSSYRVSLTLLKALSKEIPDDVLVMKMNDRYIANAINNLMYKDEYKSKFARFVLSRVSLIMKFAYAKSYIPNIPSPTQFIEWKENEKSDISKKYLDDQEVVSVLGFIRKKHPIKADVLQWQYLSGMRIGEVLALKVSDIIPDGKTYKVYVHRTLDYVGKKHNEFSVENQTKTISGMRTITMPTKANEIIKRYIKGKKKSDLVFSDKAGLPLSPQNFNRNLKTCKNKLNIDKELTTHTFRHTHVSKLAEMGVPLYVITERVGHSNSDITKKVYLHITKNVRNKYDDEIKEFK